eukprot:TRINITY_DN3173_c0_g1_i2.p1 TRINITY_DN3173_c0_g1~~TRINITY_DN3173_c0_g1_i2.p1  ORF type:complete len:339 (+),score=88.80 TRINITY_DN3173_c0_g1_i2:50-1066(+)
MASPLALPRPPLASQLVHGPRGQQHDQFPTGCRGFGAEEDSSWSSIRVVAVSAASAALIANQALTRRRLPQLRSRRRTGAAGRHTACRRASEGRSVTKEVEDAQDIETVRSEAVRALYKQSAMLAEAEKRAAGTEAEQERYLKALEQQQELLEEANRRAEENAVKAGEAKFEVEIERAKAVDAADAIRREILEDLELVREELARMREEYLEKSSLVTRSKVKARAAEALTTVRLGAMELRATVKESEVVDLRQQVEDLQAQLGEQARAQWADMFKSAAKSLGVGDKEEANTLRQVEEVALDLPRRGRAGTKRLGRRRRTSWSRCGKKLRCCLVRTSRR